jgi:DNA-binding HxlR family transcriptional regulator
MSRSLEIPVRTSTVVLALSRKACSFNELRLELRVPPSTLTRILNYLRTRGCIEVKILQDENTGLRKVFFLTKKGKKILPLFKKLDDSEAEVLQLVG